jgi:hypothetical protein
MKLQPLLLPIALVPTLWACSDNDDNPPPATSFTTFVSALAVAPSETADPIEINNTPFVISEDPHAFDTLFPP